jgi:hypothetical protein
VLADSITGGAGAAGAFSTLAALQTGQASEVFLTARYAELEVASMPALLCHAAISGVRVTCVGGVAALELDLVAGGVCARLAQ